MIAHPMDISVIIPTHNEADFIEQTIQAVREKSAGAISEVIIADGGSTDNTVSIANDCGATILHCPGKGRGTQMNFGAQHARGGILYFLHADTHPPANFDHAIIKAVRAGYGAGCFQLSFDDPSYTLQFYSWFTRLDVDVFRFGDQSLFIREELFASAGRFKENYHLMEDQQLVRQIKKSHAFAILDEKVTTSARRYRENGVLKLQLIFLLIFCLYYAGVSQQRLIRIYNRLVK